MLANIARTIGVPADQLVALAAMLAGYPLSVTFNFLFDKSTRTAANAAKKHVFSLIATSMIMFSFFDLYGWLNLVGIAVASWVLSVVLPRKRVGPATMAMVLLHLAANHLAKQLRTTLGTVKAFDYTAALMVMAIKLTSYGFSVGDAAVPEEKLTEMQKARVIRKLPGLLEFIGFAFFWGGFLAGPAFDYSLYVKWADGTLFDEMAASSSSSIVGENGASGGGKPNENGASAGVSSGKAANGDSKTSSLSRPLGRPSTMKPTLQLLSTGLLFAGLYALFGKYGYPSVLLPAYASLSLPRRLLALNIAGLASRTKFYAAWKVAEGACAAVGLGSDGRIANVRPLKIELAQSIKEYADNWNINTQSWLRFCVHERCRGWGFAGGLEIWVVFLTSSFWHGFYPGYYLTFLTFAAIIPLSRTLRASLRPLFLAPSPWASYKPVYDFASWLATQATINYTVAPFMLLQWDKSMHSWSSVYFIGHLAVFAVWLGLRMGGSSMLADLRRKFGVETERVRVKDVQKKAQ